MRNLLTVITLIGALGLVTPADLTAKDFWFEYQRVLETGPEAVLSLNFISGDLTITSSDDDRIIIEARKQVHAVSMDEAQLVADHIEIKVKHDNNKVDIETNYLRMRNRAQSFWSKVLGTGGEDSYGQVHWDIKVPTGCNITVVNTGGKINISNIVGDIDIRTSSAEIDLMSIEGAVTVANSSGYTVGELIFGPVVVRQAQGRVSLQFVEGDIKVKSGSANIDIRQDRGALDLSTSSGDIDIQTDLDSSRDFFVATESGHIILSIPETSSGDLRIESQTGDIKTEMPIAIESMSRKQLKGTFGFGGIKINLTSISGDVTVAQF